MHHRNAHQRKVRRSGNMLKEKLGIEQNSITHLLASGQRDVHQPPSLYHHHPPSPLLLLLYSIFSTTPHLFCLLYAWCTCIWNSTCSLSLYETNCARMCWSCFERYYTLNCCILNIYTLLRNIFHHWMYIYFIYYTHTFIYLSMLRCGYFSLTVPASSGYEKQYTVTILNKLMYFICSIMF